MILDLPDAIQRAGYYQGISLMFWIVATILLFLGALLFLYGITKVELKSTKMGYLANCFFCFFFGLTRLVYIIAVYNPKHYNFYVILGYIFSIISILPWLYVLETYIVPFTKKIFLILTLVAFSIVLICLLGLANRNLATFWLTILMPFSIGDR